MLDITTCPILNSENFTINNNGQILGPNPAELTAFAGKAKNLVENFNKLENLLNDIKTMFPDKYNADGTWERCFLGLNGGVNEKKTEVKGIRNVITKPCIQIGFLGPSNIGKSSTINRLFGGGDNKIAGEGSNAFATSSAVVSYYASSPDRWEVIGLDNKQLNEKYKLAIKTMMSNLSISGDYEDIDRSYQQIADKINNVGIEDKLKSTWRFIEAKKNGVVHPIGKKNISTKDEFVSLVNHSSNPDGLSVFYGRSVGLPTATTPKVFEMVDVPGVGMTFQDDYLVGEYNPNIDAYLEAYTTERLSSTQVNEIKAKSRAEWRYKNGNQNGDNTVRFSLIITKMGSLGLDYTDVYGSISSIRKDLGERFFMVETSIGKNGEVFKDALNDSYSFDTIVGESNVFGSFETAKKNNRQDYDVKFPKHIEGLRKFDSQIRQCLYDGSISSLRDFLLYQWPIQIVSEIIAKSDSDISEFLIDAANLKLKLEKLLKLAPIEISNIQNATAALTKIKVEISKAGFKPLADGLKDLINQAVAVHTYTPTTSIDQVINWLKTEAKLGATKILSQIVLDGGLIDECYKYIENQGNFSSHDLRVSPTNRDTLKLNAIWYKTAPLKKDKLNRQMQSDIQKLLIPHEVIIGLIEDNFWNTLKNKTGIDELLADLTMVRHSETGDIRIDMFDWAQSILRYQNNQKNYNRLDSLIKEAVNNLAVDCAEVIKNFLLEQINKLIDERQAILFLCT